MKIPVHLKHKPILQVANYDQIDGPYVGLSDAMGLSIGLAQWNTPGWTDLSVKVWRHTGGKWSRQSEELPLHRVIDLATLICKSIDYAQSDNKLTTTDEFPVIRVTDNNEFKHHTDLMKRELKKNKKFLDTSLKRLATELQKLGYCSE